MQGVKMTANTTKSKKGKGRRFQDKIAQDIREKFDLPEEDVKTTPMGVSGSDILLSYRARMCFPFYVECKHWANPALWEWIKQAEAGANRENLFRPPIVIFRYNHTRNTGENYAVLSYTTWKHFYICDGENNFLTVRTSKKSAIEGNIAKYYENLLLKMEVSKLDPVFPVAVVLSTDRLRTPPKEKQYVIMRWEDFLTVLERVR